MNDGKNASNNKLSITEKLYNFYHSQSFFAKNSNSIGITIVLFLVFFLINSYLFININTKYYKKNWVSYRCNPSIIPFAGIINAPPGTDKLNYTFTNFSFCLNKILDDIVSFMMAPILLLTEIITLVYDAIFAMIDEIVKMFDFLRNAITNIVLSILGSIMNFLIPFQKIIIKLRTMFKKMHATQVTTMFTFLGTYMSLISGINVIYEFVVFFAFILVAAIVVLWITWIATLFDPAVAAIATAFTTFLVIILAILIIIAVFVNKTFGIETRSLPGVPTKPACFLETTPINILGKGKIPISKVVPGMRLANNAHSLVTAVFKVSAKNQRIFRLLDKSSGTFVYVTKNHRVIINHNNKLQWIDSYKYPNAKEMFDFDEPYVYCINTTSKMINIGGLWFKDWDDMHKKEYAELEKHLRTRSALLAKREKGFVKPSTLYIFFENGFSGTTLVSLANNTQKPMKEIQIGDVLANNATVRGLVRIQNGFEIMQYGPTISCSKRCFVEDKNQVIPIDDLYKEEKDHKNNKTMKLITNNKEDSETDNDYLYHLLTTNGRFPCGNILFLDYNYNLDLFV